MSYENMFAHKKKTASVSKGTVGRVCPEVADLTLYRRLDEQLYRRRYTEPNLDPILEAIMGVILELISEPFLELFQTRASTECIALRPPLPQHDAIADKCTSDWFYNWFQNRFQNRSQNRFHNWV